MSNIITKYFLIGSLAIFFAALASCTKPLTPKTHPINSNEMVLSVENGPLEFDVEIADTPEERAQGLMGRTSLPPLGGMLFIFDSAGENIFWMKNTLISLDLIFFDDNFSVVGTIENALPMNLNFLTIGKDSRYVLEVNAGTVKKYGINLHTTGLLRYGQSHDTNTQ